MSGFLMLSRDFLSSPLWTQLSHAEKGMLLDILSSVPNQPIEYNLYGIKVQLAAFEYCFTIARLARRMGLTPDSLRGFIRRLEKAGLLTRRKRKIDQSSDRGSCRDPKVFYGNRYVTSVTFCRSVFSGFPDASIRDSLPANSPGMSPVGLPDYNKEDYINQEEAEKGMRSERSVRSYENPKVLLTAWQDDPVLSSGSWQQSLSQHFRTDPRRLSDWLQEFVANQQCQGLFFLMRCEFQRRFVRFIEQKYLKSKYAYTSDYGKSNERESGVSSAYHHQQQEQEKRIDHLAAELLGP